MAWEDEFKVGPNATYSPTMAVIFVVVFILCVLYKLAQFIGLI